MSGNLGDPIPGMPEWVMPAQPDPDIPVPEELAEFAWEYRAGWMFGLAERAGEHLRKHRPYFHAALWQERAFVWQAGRDDALVALGLRKTVRNARERNALRRYW